MTSSMKRRIAALEALPAPHRTQTPEEIHAHHVALAARCGFTEEQVMAHFGGWPEFSHACLVGKVVDPTEKKDSGRRDELLARHDGDSKRAYMEMIGAKRGR